jgi:putative PIN family toxin of toxin-antitoxin system
VFQDPGIAPIRDAVAAGAAEVYVDAACEEELERVLARGFARRTFDAQACIEKCRRLARRIEAPLAPAERARLPTCRDPDDQKFLEAALAAGAQFLVTKDAELLALARKPLPFRIIAPVQWPNYTKSV